MDLQEREPFRWHVSRHSRAPEARCHLARDPERGRELTLPYPLAVACVPDERLEAGNQTLWGDPVRRGTVPVPSKAISAIPRRYLPMRVDPSARRRSGWLELVREAEDRVVGEFQTLNLISAIRIGRDWQSCRFLERPAIVRPRTAL